MSRLTLEICPEMSEKILENLKKVGVNTVLGFLTEDVHSLAGKTSLSLEELSAIRKHLLMANSAVVWRGDYLYEKTINSLQIIPTGCPNLDAVLGGGLYTNEVTEFYGLPAVGKTQSCLSIACHIVIELQENTIYIDTGGTFSSKRVEEIMQKKCEKLNKVAGYLNNMARIKCVNVFDIYSVLAVLNEVKTNCLTHEDSFYEDVVLVVVDCVASVISPILGGLQNQGHGLMVSLSRVLKSLAMDYNLAVLVTNNVVSDFTTHSYTKPALGKTWAHMPNNRVHFSHNHDTSDAQRMMKLTKSCRMPVPILSTGLVNEYGLS